MISIEAINIRKTIQKNIDPFTSEEVLQHCSKLYSPGMRLDSPEITPLNNDLSNLPEILLQVGSDELLLSDSTGLADKLHSAGAKVKLEIRDSMWHVWHMYQYLPEAEEALQNIKTFHN